MTENKTEIVLGIIRNSENKILIIQRTKSEKGTNNSVLLWAFPGGKIEHRENRKDAIQREVLEETGYKVRSGIVISERQHPQFPAYIYYIECAVESDEPVSEPSNDEVERVKWVSPKDLKNYFTTDLDLKVAHFIGLSL